MNHKFELVQDEYSLLKQELASGRITRAQFDAALGDGGRWHIREEGDEEEMDPQDSGNEPL